MEINFYSIWYIISLYIFFPILFIYIVINDYNIIIFIPHV